MLRKFTVDGVEYEAESEVINIIKNETKRADAAEKKAKESEESEETDKKDSQKKMDKMQGEMDALKEENKKLKDDLKAMKDKKSDSADILSAVNARVSLVETAKKAGLEVKRDMLDLDIKKAVITKIQPGADLKEKSDEYVNARFDAVSEIIVSSVNAQVRSQINGGGFTGAVTRQDSVDPRILGLHNDGTEVSTKAIKERAEAVRYYESRGLAIPASLAN